MPNGSANVEQETNAQANNSAIPENAFSPKSVSESGGEEEDTGAEIPQQSKNKSHCFCPLLAKKHGEEAAVIFQGLGWKIAKSKKLIDGKKWHFDTLKALEVRWPYLKDSGIHRIIQREADAGNVFKGKFNKWKRDTTTWYSLTDPLVKRAMEEERKLWFDVDVAVKCQSIVVGTVYQNVRYHLLLFLADNPDFTGTPYYEVNKTALARVLPWSLSTIKRAFAEIDSHGLMKKRAENSKDYTITNLADLIVPDGMKREAIRNGSSTDKNGSSTETGIGSTTEITGSHTEMSGSSTDKIGSSTDKIGSSTDKIGSSTDKIGSTTDDITHYKPLKMPFTNTIHLPLRGQ